MDFVRYLDFELQVSRDGDLYRADVLRSPVGETSASFALPFTAEGLENLLLRIGTQRRGSTRSAFSEEYAAAREFGGKLFEAVFSGEIRACLRSSIDEAEGQEGVGIRLKLRFQDVGELSGLPWEFLYDASMGRFLAQSTYTPLVRYIEMPQRIRPLTVALPLRILVMVSNPDDPDYPRLDVEQEKQRIQTALDPLLKTGKIEVDWLEKATLSELQRALLRADYHGFHFIGHGGFDRAEDEGVLVLEDDLGRGQRASARRLGPLLHDARLLRLAFLNSCEGARNSKDDAFSSVATSLIRQGVPAVVAMQFEITDAAAITFASGFYAALADGYPVDTAVSEGRKAVMAQPNDVEWATPVLYMRSPDGVLFDLTQTPAADMTIVKGEPTVLVRSPSDLDHPTVRQPEPDATIITPRLNPDATIVTQRPAPTPEAPPEHAPAPVQAAAPAAPEPAPLMIEPERPAQAVPIPVSSTSSLITMGLTPEKRGLLGRRSTSATYTVSLRNLGAATKDLRLDARAGADGYVCWLPSTVTVPGGARRTTVQLVVSAERKSWRGSKKLVPFTVTASGDDGEPPLTIKGEFEDQPYGWLPVLAAGIPVLGIGAGILVALGIFSGGDNDKKTAFLPPPADSLTPQAPAGGTAAPGRIFFSSNRADGLNAQANNNIWVMDPDGANARPVRRDATDESDPSATPNGSRVVFISDRDGNGQPELYVMSGEGADVRRITNNPEPDTEPDISPDGKRVAFERQPAEGKYTLHIVEVDSLKDTSLNILGVDPDWSPDGSRLVFGARPNELGANANPGRNPSVSQIYTMNADGSGLTRLTDAALDSTEPAWSPDGRRIAFQQGFGNDAEIWVMNSNGSSSVALTNNQFQDEDPSWSPDSTLVLYQSNRGANRWDVYVINHEGGLEKTVGSDPSDDRKPVWTSP